MRTLLSIVLPQHMVSGLMGLTAVIGSSLGVASLAVAQTVEDPESVLNGWLQQQLTAANAQDLEGVLESYSPYFVHQDGLDLDETRAALVSVWDNYDTLRYDGQLEDWEDRGSELVATFAITITGEQLSERGSFQLTGSQLLRNRYRLDAEGSLVLSQQEVLEESTTLVSGDNPPAVTLRLPERVATGSTYRLEAIVQEPIRNTLLLGTVIEEPVSPQLYLDTSAFPLEPLQAGGIFRQADAPTDPGADWISVMFVTQGGLTLESRRVTVTNLPL
ncbi:MAG: hypothetical protein ACFCU9_11970 [Cyanophyceae cyanobacterium]